LKYFLVVLFLMQDGTWLPGDLVAPDGWSSIKYQSLQECEERKDAFNENMAMTDYANLIKSVCQATDPSIPSKML
jgi:hypothetical protein